MQRSGPSTESITTENDYSQNQLLLTCVGELCSDNEHLTPSRRDPQLASDRGVGTGAARLLLSAALFLSAAVEATASDPPLEASVVYPLDKLRPNERPPCCSSAPLIRLAAGEYELVGISFYNPGPSSVDLVDVSLTYPSRSPHQVEAFVVDYVDVRRRSRLFTMGGWGRWPDPLLPLQLATTATTPGAGVARADPTGARLGALKRLLLPATATAFPPPSDVVTVIPPGEHRMLVLDIYRPRLAPPSGGEWWQLKAAAAVQGAGTAAHAEVRFPVRPLPYSLPRMPAFATSFGFRAHAIAPTHLRLSQTPVVDEFALEMEYVRLLARSRLSLYRPLDRRLPSERDAEAGLSVDWSEFDAITGALLDGTFDERAPPATSFQIPRPDSKVTGKKLSEFYRMAASHLRNRGWLDRAYVYLFPDEPLRREYDQIRERASEVRNGDRAIRTLVVEPFSPLLADHVDIWVPMTTMIGDSLRFLPMIARGPEVFLDWQPIPPPETYRERRNQGETTWIYTTGERHADQPNLFIDASAMHARLLPWLAFRYGFTGLLYYNTVGAYLDGGDPRTDLYRFGANGDGTLVYPGLPEVVGTHRPLPSLRLLLLREGMEDYEHLQLLAARIGPEAAVDRARTILESSLHWERTAMRFGVEKKVLFADLLR